MFEDTNPEEDTNTSEDDSSSEDTGSEEGTNLSEDTDSLVEPCAAHPDCTLSISSAKNSIKTGEQVQITATGANGAVSWEVTGGCSTLDSDSGTMVTLTGNSEKEVASIQATDALGCTASLQVTIVAPIQSQTIARFPANRDRLKIGVGEEVLLSMSGGDSAQWSISSGNGTLSPASGSQSSVTFTADKSAGDATITATCDAGSYDITFNVVEPSNLTMIQFTGTPLAHPYQNRPWCAWLGRACVHPNDVNFYRLLIREQDSVAKGWGSFFPMNTNLKHGNYANGHSDWIPLTMYYDAYGTCTGVSDQIDSGSTPEMGSVPPAPPFTAGYMYYNMQWNWKVYGTNDSTAQNFPAFLQEHWVNAQGQVISRKAGYGLSTMYNDPVVTLPAT